MSGHVPGWMLSPTRLRFSEAMPSRSGTHAFRALNQHGPYDASQLELGDGAILFVFPGGEQRLARKLASALLGGIGTYRGFEKLFRVPVAMGPSLKSLSVDTDLADLHAAGEAYRDAIAAWNAKPRDRDREPDVAIVLVPHSERFDTEI